MSRPYGPIGTNVWDSERFLSLETDSARLAYLYLIACPHGNAVGVFRLPAVYFAADRRKSEAEANAILDDLSRVGLIDRGDGDIIRVSRWFYHETGAANPSTASKFCKLFKETRMIKRSPQRTRALVEMIFATLTKAEGWNPESAPFGTMTRDIHSLLAGELKQDAAGLIAAFREYPEPEFNGLLYTVLDTVLHTVGGHGVQHVYHIQTQTRKRDTDTETDTDTDTETDTDWTREAAKIPQIGPKKTPDDLQQTIAALTARAGPKRSK